ncbi:MAG: hypothetical protein PHV28_00680 [Kiritimatiellae bacterium]|nr:hypothetical protein [Kiritimatiellia bacterium]
MAEQDQVPQGAIPPKVSPFAKPEGAAPGVPNAPRPITVRLKPAVAPAAAAHAAPPAVGIQTPAPANPRSTARVPMPEVQGAEPVTQKGETAAAPRPVMAAPATVRLRPVMPAPAGARVPGTPQPATPPAPVPAVSPLQPQPPPAPGSHPLPDGPKPLSGVQVQASKSKTSRISLDSAIGVAPMSPMSVDKAEPKTIRLKRPSDLAAAPSAPKSSTTPIRQTSRIPDSVLPNAETKTPETGAITQKKTLKIKRPGAKAEGASAGEGTPGEAFPENVQMTPISALNLPEKQESSAFTAVAVAAAAVAAVVLLLLTLCLGAHAMGPDAGKNAVASVGGPELPWAGRISD